MTRLLLDENLSEAVLPAIDELFPDSLHVRSLHAAGASDAAVWELAKSRGCILVTRDMDFQTLSVLRGHPPKVVHIGAFNPSTARVIAALRNFASAVTAFDSDPEASFLSLIID